MEWTNVKNQLIPENQLVIAINCYENQDGSECVNWICIGKVDPAFKGLPEYDYRTNIETTVGVGVHGIKWWHPIPELPWKEDKEWFADDDWIKCDNYPPLQKRNDPFEFILFDEENGIAECEYWGGYQSDTWSCKHYFRKPLFWRPFPRLPIKSKYVLQC